GLPRGERPSVADNEYRIQYSNKNQDLINLDETSTSLGDIQIAAARSVLKNNRTTMSLWGSVKLPTGDKSKLSGNGATDFSTWLALNQQFTNSWLMNINAGTVFLGSDNFQNIPLSDHVYYGHIMLGWLASEFFDLKVQLQGHTSYYRKTRLRAIGDTYFMTFGTSIKINQCNRLDIAVSEDIKVNASPDVSLLINWRSYSAGC
ncbi:MAG TPA: DUF3187 family protein, partial [Gammaproteobacteria bacterium]|nr:DUF3187 family protein [Gammaproteobacteria bacterium]